MYFTFRYKQLFFFQITNEFFLEIVIVNSIIVFILLIIIGLGYFLLIRNTIQLESIFKRSLKKNSKYQTFLKVCVAYLIHVSDKKDTTGLHTGLFSCFSHLLYPGQ